MRLKHIIAIIACLLLAAAIFLVYTVNRAGQEINQTPPTDNVEGDQPDIATTLKNGAWGGEHIQFTVTAEGAQIEFDCAAGTIAHPIQLAADGTFTAAGRYIAGSGGPQRQGQAGSNHPAVYAGKATNNNLTLTVTLADTHEIVATFYATFGTEAKLFKCL